MFGKNNSTSQKQTQAQGQAGQIIGLALIAAFIVYATNHDPAKTGGADPVVAAFAKVSSKVFPGQAETTSNPLETSLNIPQLAAPGRTATTSGQIYVVVEEARSTADQYASAYPEAVAGQEVSHVR